MIAACLLLLQSPTLQAPTREITFTYRPDHAVHSVSLAGSFNAWNKDATPLQSSDDGRTWQVRLAVPYGHQEYKFVIDGSNWIVDPSGKAVDDGNGHTNTLLLVAPPDFDRPASPNDGIVAASAVLHQQTASYLNYDHGELAIRVRTRANDVAEVGMVGGPRGSGRPFRLHLISTDEMYSTYELDLPWDRETSFTYEFFLVDGPKRFWYGPDGLSGKMGASFTLDAKTYKPIQVPDWVQKTVFYQIFPDRFANGDPTNDPPNVQPWDGKPTYSNRFGGDAAGVKQHIGYLADLGVGAVYFNPVFESPSNHRYDTTDYLKIDPEFGTNKEFDDLTAAMKAKGIRTVMDIAFNHTATNFAPFKDIREHGQASPYTSWYWIKSYPVVPRENPPYVAWDNYPSMPKLNVMNPATHEYALGVLHSWLKNAHGVEGYRFDVANEIDERFWRDVRQDLKKTDPNVWIVGEEWGDASHWLQGDEWDASMDYPFRDACLQFFAQKSSTPTEFTNALMTNYLRYAPQVSRNELNLLGSHDTPRLLTLCHDDAALDELAATVQFTWVGAPSIYYGDEIGMDGEKDPDNRRGMVWSKANDSNPMLSFYKKLVHLRNGSRVLQEGDPRILFTSDSQESLAYARELDSELAIVALNRSDQPQSISIRLPESAPYSTAAHGGFFDALTGHRYAAAGHELTLLLAPKSAEVLLPSKGHVSSVRSNVGSAPSTLPLTSF